MSVPILQLIPSVKGALTNEFGETPLAYAPMIRLANGRQAVPQQFLDVKRNLTNLSTVLAQIDVPSGFQLFAGQEATCLFIVVGLFGKENYPGSSEIAERTKIVYGRRWLIEESTPTSEIVQTALLAVKKAREHEVRELLSLKIKSPQMDESTLNRTTTPFNCHIDLPLLAGASEDIVADLDQVVPIEELIERVRLDKLSLELVDFVTLGSKLIIELKLASTPEPLHFPELEAASLTTVCEYADGRDFLHQLCKVLIEASDRYVEENFAFQGCKRFSHNICPQKLAEFSYRTRNITASDDRFDSAFADMSYRVDAAKAPAYNAGELGRKQRAEVSKYPNLAGYLPRESD